MRESRYITARVLQRAQEIEKCLAGRPACHGVSIQDRAFWENASARIDRAELLGRAAKYAQEPVPVITEEIYFERRRGEKKPQADKILFSAMRRLEQAVLAECLEDQGAFLPYIIQGLEAICDRKSLVRPGHDAAFRYCDYLGGHGLIDLYASSVAWRLAEIDCMLAPRLPESLRSRVKRKIRQKVLDVFFARLYENPQEIAMDGMVPLYWLDGFDNWLAVCLSGVVCAGLYFDEPEKQPLYIALYEALSAHYLASLPDGDCVEGLAYWGYGFGKFIAASDLICRLTAGKLDLYAQPEFLKAAAYGRNSRICRDVYPSVADCGYGTKPQPFCLDYLHLRETGSGESLRRTKVDFSQDLYIAMMMLNFQTCLLGSLGAPAPDGELRTWFQHRSVLISREPSRDLGVYIQGGHNHGPHNHNDLGSFIIAAHGDTFVADPGFSVYDSVTFSPERYTYEVLSSYGHSVPRVAGRLQGPEKYEAVNTGGTGIREAAAYESVVYRADVLEKAFKADADSLSLDLTKAYDAPTLQALTRRMVMDRSAGEIVITDCFAFSREETFESALITYLPVEVETPQTLLLRGRHGSMRVSVDAPGAGLCFSCVKHAVTGDHDVPAHPLRIAIRGRWKEGSVTLRFRWFPSQANARP